MDTRIGHDSPNEALTARQTAQHVRALLFSRAPQGSSTSNFTHHDKQVKSERILRKLGAT
jgi:hypothetical protein